MMAVVGVLLKLEALSVVETKANSSSDEGQDISCSNEQAGERKRESNNFTPPSTGCRNNAERRIDNRGLACGGGVSQGSAFLVRLGYPEKNSISLTRISWRIYTRIKTRRYYSYSYYCCVVVSQPYLSLGLFSR